MPESVRRVGPAVRRDIGISQQLPGIGGIGIKPYRLLPLMDGLVGVALMVIGDTRGEMLSGRRHLALPKQVADQFVLDPSAYTQKSRMGATIVFMDFVGFTSTCEALAHDPDLLSHHLEAAMDRLVEVLVRTTLS